MNSTSQLYIVYIVYSVSVCVAIICFIIFYNFIMDCLCLMPAHNHHHHHRPVHMWIAMRSCPPLVVVVVTIVVVVVVVIACSYCCCCCCCRQLSSLCICGLSQFALIASKYAVIIDLAPISILMYIVHIYLCTATGRDSTE